MNIPSKIKAICRRAIAAPCRWLCDFIEDRHCENCGCELNRQEYGLCPSCQKTLIADRADFDFLSSQIQRLLADKAPAGACGVLMPYRKGEAAFTLIHLMKYRHYKNIGRMFGLNMALKIRTLPSFQYIDLVVPIPLHPRREAERGYNQSEVIARTIADELHLALDTHNLYRTRNNQSQTRVGSRLRAENTKDLFALRSPGEMQGKCVLLIDDVVTTGSTVAAAIKQLAAAGARVLLFAVATPIHPAGIGSASQLTNR